MIDAGPRRPLGALAFYGLIVAFNAMYFAVLGTRGFSPLWLGATVVAQFVLVSWLETVLPDRLDWKASRKGTLGADLLTPLFNQGVARPLLNAMPFVGLILAPSALDLHRFRTPLSELPLGAQVVLAWLLVELCSYTLHRLNHGTPLWRMHHLHHSPRELFALRFPRLHVVDDVLSVVITAGVPVLLGLDRYAVGFALRNVVIVGMLTHSNIRFGPLPALAITPAIHRLHHSAAPEHRHVNYGLITIFWDKVFGTLHEPSEAEVASLQLGVEGSDLPQSWLAQLGYPFWPLLPGRAQKVVAPRVGDA